MRHESIDSFSHATYSAPTEQKVRQSLNLATERTSGAGSLTSLEIVALAVACFMALYPLGAFTYGVYFGTPAA